MYRQAVLLLVILFPAGATAFDDSGWTLRYQESFDTPYEATDGQVFGEDGWLVYQLINGGTITVNNGVAHLQTPDFFMAGLIHSTANLPAEYRVRTKVGYINYDLTNYDPEDLENPDFHQHGGHLENGVYFLTLTDGLCEGDECAELWWHWHRKMVIDVDNHENYSGGGITFHPVFMVYMGLEDDGGAQGHVLRSWDGTAWDTSPWNWNVAYTYEYATWYYAEVDKRDGHLTLRLYDGNQQILVETDPVPLELINAMDDPVEYLYLGEPHTDDYEGDVLFDDITLLVPDDAADSPPLPELLAARVVPNPFNPSCRIQWEQPFTAPVTLRVFDERGALVTHLVDEELPAGTRTIGWDGRDSHGRGVPSGVYFFELQTAGHRDRGKLTLVR